MSNMALVIDDQISILESMEIFFRMRQWGIYTAATGQEGLRLIQERNPQLVILDLRLPDMNGLQVLEIIKHKFPETHVIMVTAYQDMESTIQAIKLGAFDYLHKPININEMEAAIRRLEQSSSAIDETDKEAVSFSDDLSVPYIVGKSRAMKEVFKKIALLSESRVTVLIQGESGTGKELIARAIHFNSPSRNEPFTAIDCTTFVDNLIESALFGYEKGAFTGAQETRKGRLEITSNGTIFFDEIGEIPIHLQSKLLRFIQEREFVRVGGTHFIQSNARIIAATNRNLTDLVSRQMFRRDLYFRLKVVTIEVPSLRDHRSDIPILASFLLKKISTHSNLPHKSLTREALNYFMDYDWPGNVRELENTLTHAVVITKSKIVTKNDVLLSHQEFVDSSDKKYSYATLDTMEKEYMGRVLESCRWHLGQTCKVLGISRPTLRAKIKKYGLSKAL